MSSSPFFILLILLGFLGPFVFIFLASWWPNRQKNGHKLPPGPQPLPIIGNLHILGNLPHRTLHQLAKRYGPIMFMKLGCVPTLVVSSPQTAELILKTHDIIFANRPQIQSRSYISLDSKGMALTGYGPYWRNIKKLCTLNLLSVSKIEYFSPMRREEIALLVDSLKNAAATCQVVDVSARITELMENMTCRLLFGSCGSKEFHLMPIVKEAMLLIGAFNLSDYIPWLAPFDLQGLTRRMKAFRRAMCEVLDKIIDDHEQDVERQSGRPRDFVDVLLELMNEHRDSDNDLEHTIDRTSVKAILIDMILGSLETATNSVEWAFSEVLRHPRVMKCAQKELQSVVGMNRIVEEADLSKLTYLEMVIKESFRLHPVAPLLGPHESIEDILIDGFYIPKKSRVLVNIWAIGRDANVWSENVNEFLPERFKDTNIDLYGQDFQLLPFGSGRRGCPGMQLGLTIVRLLLAQLLHCFNWELPDGLKPDDIDMTEIFGIATPRAHPLLAIPTYRLHN